ncbi:DEAD/DEAH box helicase [Roseomonas sp. USHLN139]|uniref:DEAD/DEAH box helicase n=1 Tax=Roseomonas sp. USHLN139 TaxID=3081298 RepID=UPI003B010CA9
MTDFTGFGLAEPIQRALTEEGYTTPTPIQAAALPHLMQGRDLVGLAQTGTGKTAAFALPIMHRLMQDKRPAPRLGARVLVLAPTRELATQIGDSFTSYGRHLNLSKTVIFGGVGQGRQADALRRGVDVLVAAPGRLLDLCNQGLCDLSQVEVLVLDEADRMLDMGFVRDIRRIVAMLPTDRQTIMFSATMPASVAQLAGSLLRNPERVEVAPPSTTVQRIRQTVMFVEAAEKKNVLLHLVGQPSVGQAIVFTLMKHEANKVADSLNEAGVVAAAIHGNKSQARREAALNGFRSGEVKVLVATDIAARGIDVDEVTHVFNFDLPNEPASYVHRIGRTARAGRDGWAISLCDEDQRAWLRDIEKEIGKPITVFSSHPWHSEAAANSTKPAPKLGGGGHRGPRPPHGGGQRSGQGQGHGQQGRGDRAPQRAGGGGSHAGAGPNANRGRDLRRGPPPGGGGGRGGPRPPSRAR